MTPPNPLTALASRVERLTGPCRETDALIVVALNDVTRFKQLATGFSWTLEANENGSVSGYVKYPDGKTRLDNRQDSPHYTASLDTAMTLVPDGWGFAVGDVHGPLETYCERGKAWAEIWTRDDIDIRIPEMNWCENHNHLNAETPALALTAASLRARAASESHHDS